MSVRIMADVWGHFPGSGSKLLVMLAFADYSNEHGDQIFPSMRALSKRVRLTESQARRVVHHLIREGWVDVVANEFGGAPGMTRHYRINVEKLRETPSVDASPTPSADARGTGSTDAGPSVDARPRTDARDGSHPCAERASAHASQTVNEPSVTTSVGGQRTKTRGRFTPPTVDEVAEYCRSRGNQVDAERFVDHYTANGWKVGRNAMKDWKAAVRTWEKNNHPGQPQQTGGAGSGQLKDFPS